jgi:2-aminoadipate transaminase
VSTTQSTQVDLTSAIIDLGIGQPGFDLLPLEIMRRAAEERFAEGDTFLLNYGYEQGDGRFRAALASFLTGRYGIPVSSPQLMVTAGASQALDLICTQFAQPGDVVFVEEPSYFLALRILREDHRLHVVSLPVDEEGLIPEVVEAALPSLSLHDSHLSEPHRLHPLSVAPGSAGCSEPRIRFLDRG